MTGTELVNIIKSPTSKIVMFGTLLITGALILVPMLNRNEDPEPERRSEFHRSGNGAPAGRKGAAGHRQ